LPRQCDAIALLATETARFHQWLLSYPGFLWPWNSVYLLIHGRELVLSATESVALCTVSGGLDRADVSAQTLG